MYQSNFIEIKEAQNQEKQEKLREGMHQCN